MHPGRDPAGGAVVLGGGRGGGVAAGAGGLGGGPGGAGHGGGHAENGGIGAEGGCRVVSAAQDHGAQQEKGDYDGRPEGECGEGVGRKNAGDDGGEDLRKRSRRYGTGGVQGGWGERVAGYLPQLSRSRLR